MKKLKLLLICCMTLLLSACHVDKPYQDTTESQQRENTETMTDSEEVTQSPQMMVFDIIQQVSKEQYDRTLEEVCVIGIAKEEYEWESWAKIYLPDWRELEFFADYESSLFATSDLVLYGTKQIKQQEGKTQYQVLYHIEWREEVELSRRAKEKYLFGNLYVLDEKNAYYIYVDSLEYQIMVESTNDGGKSWQLSQVENADILPSASSDIMVSFLDVDTGFLLYVGDAALGQQYKLLLTTMDGGKSWQTVADISDKVSRYPMDIAFFTEDVGYILTNTYMYYSYATSSSIGDILYQTKDGGKTWLPVTPPFYPNKDEMIQGVCIDSFSNTDGMLVLEINKQQGDRYVAEVCVCYTEDAGQTWTKVD